MSLERIGRLEQRADNCDERTTRHELRLNSHGKEIRKISDGLAGLRGWLIGAAGAGSFIATIIANYLLKVAE